MEKKKHDRIQQECWAWLWNTYPLTRKLCWHTPNELQPFEGESHAAFIRRLSYRKSIGVVDGVWDLVFYWHNCLYIFDVKLGNDYIKPEQAKFAEQVIAQGGKAFEIETLQEFKTIICQQVMNVK